MLKTIFHEALNIFQCKYKITLEPVPGSNQYKAMRLKCLAQTTYEKYPPQRIRKLCQLI